MDENIKFIHLSDVHIGANPLGIEERFEDMGLALKQVIEFGIKEKVKFFVLPGDLFHSKELNAKTLEQAINILKPAKVANIKIFVTEGNHDMKSYINSYSWLEFLSKENYIYLLNPVKLENGKRKLTVFEDGKGSIYNFDDVSIIGLGYPGSTATKMIENVTKELEEYEESFKEKVVICMLHAGIDKFVTEGMAGIKKEDIEKLVSKIDYLALGHIHTRYEDKEYKLYNPGSIECVRISDEPFNKGFYLVSINKKTKEIESEFKTVKIRNSYSVKVNLNKIENIDNTDITKYILNKLDEELKEYVVQDKIMLQLKITGGFSKDLNIDTEDIKEKLKQKYNLLYIEILNQTEIKDELDLSLQDDNKREDIDKAVIKDRIKTAGFNEQNIDTVYNIIEKLKEYATDTKINIKSVEGKEIEDMLYLITGDVDEN